MRMIDLFVGVAVWISQRKDSMTGADLWV